MALFSHNLCNVYLCFLELSHLLLPLLCQVCFLCKASNEWCTISSVPNKPLNIVVFSSNAAYAGSKAFHCFWSDQNCICNMKVITWKIWIDSKMDTLPLRMLFFLFLITNVFHFIHVVLISSLDFGLSSVLSGSPGEVPHSQRQPGREQSLLPENERRLLQIPVRGGIRRIKEKWAHFIYKTRRMFPKIMVHLSLRVNIV